MTSIQFERTPMHDNPYRAEECKTDTRSPQRWIPQSPWLLLLIVSAICVVLPLIGIAIPALEALRGFASTWSPLLAIWGISGLVKALLSFGRWADRQRER